MNTVKKVLQPFRITANWGVLSMNLQKKLAQLTDTDLKVETGKEDELIKRMETRLNKKVR